MHKRFIGVFVLGAALCAGPALAAQNVANTSQKGSLLIYPLITTDPQDAADTVIEISNDETSGVQIECEYVNQAKGRVDFDFYLTPKATATWDVDTGYGDNVFAPSFPTNVGSPTFSPANVYDGELVCFAVNASVQNQIAFNHLTGTATIVYQDDSDADQTRQAFRYNAWAFIARNASGLGAADNTIQGSPGLLQLTGGGAGTYDACPLYNIADFSPNGTTGGTNTPTGPMTTLDNDLWAVSCNQDLRQDYVLHLTKLLFTVWNANENSFTGSYQCADSVTYVGLSAEDNVGGLTNVNNFNYSTLRTANARFQVQGIASTQCPGSQASGLLGVLTSSIGINDLTLEDAELGSTTFGAGAESGFVYWDPESAVSQVIPKG
jgi:hypothetical protein